MDLTHDDVLEILALIERSDVAYLELQLGDTHIVADRSGNSAGRRVAEPAPNATPTPPAPTPPAPTPGAAMPAPTAPQDPGPAPQPEHMVPDGGPGGDHGQSPSEELVEVTAPVVGVFYRASEPGADPYIEVGSRVKVGDTLGLVEVMKMFNSVTADVAGKVVAIQAENEEFVEYGQTLITIRSEV